MSQGTKDATTSRVEQRLHQHYDEWFVGDGAKTEFLLTRKYTRTSDVLAFVDGSVKRPADSGTAYDYSLRGLTAGYAGEQNAVKFAVAPANTKNVLIRIIST